VVSVAWPAASIPARRLAQPVRRSANGNFKRFKQLLESRGAETGGWRGPVASALKSFRPIRSAVSASRHRRLQRLKAHRLGHVLVKARFVCADAVVFLTPPGNSHKQQFVPGGQ
jgi:hypothetical protein